MWDEKKLSDLDAALRGWAERVREELEKRPERKDQFVTPSGIIVNRLYTPSDISGLDYERDLGFPGDYPFTRGVQRTMYRGKLWTTRQYAGYGTAEQSNQHYKYLLSEGQMGLSVAFDLPTQLGYDSDHPMAQGEVGRVGVAIDSLLDMEELFAGIPLDKISTSMTCNALASVMLAMYIAVAEKQGLKPELLTGTIQNDILKEYVARGTYIFPPAPSMRLVTDTVAFCTEEVPRWNTISICGYHMREAGCDAIQELAFMIANGIEYVKACLDAGLEVDRFAPRLSWLPNTHINFFEEIAKFRAARRIWARIMKERFGAKNPASCAFRVFTGTGGSTFTAQQPLNNIIRGAIEFLAAVLGGAQACHVASYDEALSLPTDESVRVAMRTQQIVALETGVADTVDPLGGSYFVESLTGELERRALALIDKIESMGGAVAAVERGFVQRQIGESAYRFQKEVESGTRPVIGVNRCVAEESGEMKMLRAEPWVEDRQRGRLEELRAGRDSGAVGRALSRLRDCAMGRENMMPPVLEAVKSYATIGEIAQVLRDVFGSYRPPNVF